MKPGKVEQLWLRRLFAYRCDLTKWDRISNSEHTSWCRDQFGDEYFKGQKWSRWDFDCSEFPPKNFPTIVSDRAWAFYFDEFYFNRAEDAILFKLRWDCEVQERYNDDA